MAGRSGNGESTIYKGADGRWHGYVSVGFTATGKPDRRHVTGKTRAVVVQKVRDLEQNATPAPSPPSPPRPSPTGSNTG
jgi:integrase